MATVTILVPIDDPNRRFVQKMLESIRAQTVSNWEVVFFVSDRSEPEDYIGLGTEPNCYVMIYQNRLLMPTINAVRNTFGNFVFLMGQHDQLDPSALESLIALDADIAYSDDYCFSRWGYNSFYDRKPPINKIRLMHHNYLSRNILIRTSWLLERGGFNEQATDDMAHDLILAGLESAKFGHCQEFLYKKYRNALIESKDIREKEYIPSYDLAAIKDFWNLENLYVGQTHGIPSIQLVEPNLPSACLVMLLTADMGQNWRLIQSRPDLQFYPNMRVVGLYVGPDADMPEVASFCDMHKIEMQILGDQSEVEALNKLARSCDTEIFVVNRAVHVYRTWLRDMVQDLNLFNGQLIGPRTFHRNKLAFGLPDHKYTGQDWNHRGRFSDLTTPRNASAVHPNCLVLRTRKLVELGYFDTTLPTLYGIDYAIRLDQAGESVIWDPRISADVGPDGWSQAELDRLTQKRPDWVDPYGMFSLS